MIEDEEVKSFFEFLISNRAKNKYTNDLKTYVTDAKLNMNYKRQFMEWERQRAYDFRYGYTNGIAEGRKAGLAEGKKQGLEEGKQQGLTEGKTQKAVEAAKNLLKLKLLTPKQIAQAEDLPLETVHELAAQI